MPIAASEPRVGICPDALSSHVTLHRQVSKPLFCIGIEYPDPPSGKDFAWHRDLTVSVLCETLFSHAGDFYSHLFESGLVSPGMSYGFLVGDPSHLPARLAYGYLDLSGESDRPEEVFCEFRAFVEKIHRDGLPKADLERAKRVIYADFVAGFDTTEDIASLLGNYALDGLCAYDFPRALESVTYEDVTALFRKTFRDDQYTLSVVLPPEENS